MNDTTGYLSVFLLLSLFPAVFAAQQPPTQPTREDIMRENLERRMNTMRNLDTLARKQAELDRGTAPKTRYYRPELTKDLEKRIEIDESLRARYASTLSMAGTGIVRLVEQADCSGIKKASKAVDCYQGNANIREFANAYSFRERSRTHFGSSDIAAAKGYFVGGRRSVQTILVSLQGAELAEVSAETPELAYLFEFKPAEDAGGMDSQFEDLRAGMTVANFKDGRLSGKVTYSKAAAIQPGGTYALRAIGYRSAELAPGDKDADVIVVFRVIESDGRGGATILWREISRKPGMVMREDAAESANGK